MPVGLGVGADLIMVILAAKEFKINSMNELRGQKRVEVGIYRIAIDVEM